MKKVLLIILLLINASAFAQLDTNKYAHIEGTSSYILKSDSAKYIQFDGRKLIDIRKATPEQLQRIAFRKRLAVLATNRFWGLYVGFFPGDFPRHSLALRFQQNTGATVYQGNNWQWGTLFRNTVIVDGNSSVEVIDGFITPANAKDYRYRIIQNDNKELKGWTVPNDFRETEDGKTSYCHLGTIENEENQFVLVEIYNIHNYKDRDAIIIDWRKPRALNFWTTVDYRTKIWGSAILSASLGKDKKSGYYNFVETDTLTDIKFRLGDSLVRMGFRSMNLPTPYNYQISLKRTINDKTENIELGEYNGSYYLYKEYWNKPGQYEITFTPKLVKPGGRPIRYLTEKATQFKFTVLPELHPKSFFSTQEFIIIGIVWCAFFGAVIGALVTWLKKKNKKNLAKEQQQKELAKTQLAVVRSQLNPHFMFNALAGIQNLMNKQKTNEANHYLAKFARLTRNVLDDKELVSLAEEQALLTDYLQMEQLRFGFSYDFKVDDKLDIVNIEIPAMLLQPFVENAIKHGIDQREKAGYITVSFEQDENDLLLKVADNGQGFDVAKNYDGLGLKLSKNRISLLNAIYQQTPLNLAIAASEKGTTITITLTQWL